MAPRVLVVLFVCSSGLWAVQTHQPESVRLLGPTRCSGRLEVRPNGRWRSVCEGALDHQDAEVVCRELGCGPPSVLRGALYGPAQAALWSTEFRCKGNESRLLDCGRSDSDTNTCSPDKAVGLTCSEPPSFRLVGGSSRCAGELEGKREGRWKPGALLGEWTLKTAASVCKRLDCGSAVSITSIGRMSRRTKGGLIPHYCRESPSPLSDPASVRPGCLGYNGVSVICSESVRLLGPARCSGRLEVRPNGWWQSVFEGALDHQDAEVVCRELGCGPPSVLQGALYGPAQAALWSTEFRCKGNESRLQDCGRSDSDTNTCSPDKAVGLTCSEPPTVRLVGGSSRCTGELEVKHNGEWRPAATFGEEQTLMTSFSVCKQLDCGSAVSSVITYDQPPRPLWKMDSHCVKSTSSLSDCVVVDYEKIDSDRLSVICSGNSYQVHVNLFPPGQRFHHCFSDVMFHDGALVHFINTRLQDCGRNTCSPDKAVGLTCSEPPTVRLVTVGALRWGTGGETQRRVETRGGLAGRMDPEDCSYSL